jgi:predicted acyl esterase/SAM-dependent methyltransferase
LIPRCGTLVNCYGLTEGTIFQSFAFAREAENVTCGSICYPDPDYGRAYIIVDGVAITASDSIGQVGEVAFAGGMLPRRGYENAPELTASKFVPDPTGWVSPRVGKNDCRYGKVMLTGDLGCWKDGCLRIVGRADDQVKIHGSRLDLKEVETAVASVREIAQSCVAVAKNQIVIAYYVPTASASDRAMLAPVVEENAEVEIWEEIYDVAYSKKDAIDEEREQTAEDLITNWSAYISSYAGKLWPRQIIDHWVNATVDRFLDHGPKRILEHGCGNGMLLFRAALHPSVEEVWGADLSGEAVKFLEEVRLNAHFKHIANKLKTLHRPADNFDGVPQSYFDCIVMSAMVYYFPNMTYLLDVLRKCSEALREGGYVYIGDCRSLEHLQHFHTDVCLYNADDAMTVETLLQQCRERSGREKELLISPMFWHHVATLLPGCFTHAVTMLRRGTDCPEDGSAMAGSPCEMTRWRYDVYLYKDARPGSTAEATWEKYSSPQQVQQARARADSGETVVLTGIPNPRVLDAVAAEELMPKMLDSNVATLKEMIADWRAARLPAIDPEDLINEVDADPQKFYAQLVFSIGDLATYDAVFYPCSTKTGALRKPINRTGPLETRVDFARRVAPPLGVFTAFGRLRVLEAYGNKRRFHEVERELKAAVEQSLPRYAVPTVWVPLDDMPLGPTGKIDKRKLPDVTYETVLRKTRAKIVAPTTSCEKGVVECWQTIFPDQEIGIDDNFTSLGGHSLLAARLVGKLREFFSIDVSLDSVFAHPTPREFAAMLSSEQVAVETAAPGPKAAVRRSGLDVVVEDISVPVPGATLAARWFRPAGEVKKGCVIVDFSPYAFTYMTANVDAETFPDLVQRAEGTLSALRVAARGFDNSTGVCSDPYSQQVQEDDFLEAVKWVASEPWCTEIVLHGFSWGGTACLRVASRGAPKLKAVCMCSGNDDLYQSDVFFDGGVPLLFNFSWAAQFALLAARPPTEGNADEIGAAWRARISAATNLPAKHLAMNDPASPYWKEQSVRHRGYENLNVPILVAAGVNGGYCDAAMRILKDSQTPVRALLGPWVHQYPHLSAIGPHVDWVGEVLQMVNGRLLKKELDVFVLAEPVLGPDPPVRLKGQWVSVDLAAQFVAEEMFERSASSVIPATLVGAAGGEWFSWGVGADLPGDQEFDDANALCFDFPVEKPVRVLGRPKITVNLEATAGVICCRLNLLRDGKNARLSWGMLSPGAVRDAELELHFCTLILREGDILRVSLSQTNFPMFLPEASRTPIPVSGVKVVLPLPPSTTAEMPGVSATSLTSAHKVALRRAVPPRHERSGHGTHDSPLHLLLDDGVVDVPGSGVRVATRGEIHGEGFMHDDTEVSPRITCRYESTMSRLGWHGKTTVEANLTMPPEGGAVVTLQLSAMENGIPIANRSFETKISSLMPPLAV